MQSNVLCILIGMSSGLLKSYSTKLGSLLHCLSRSNRALLFLRSEVCNAVTATVMHPDVAELLGLAAKTKLLNAATWLALPLAKKSTD